jgi:hypothetical protein
MKIRIERGLAYVETRLVFRGQDILIANVILDTGSASTLFSADRLLEVGVAPDPLDALRRIRGVGGTEYVFTKQMDRLIVGDLAIDHLEIEVGAMDYGFPADGILGLDFLIRTGALVDLRNLELRASTQ